MSNPQRPLASVVVINYNDGIYVSDCLSSLLDQDMHEDDYEVIFADNGSTDGSVDIVRNQFPEVRLIEFGQNYGFSEGNNRAVEHARGRYVVFLNVDTVVHRKWLSELVRVAESDAEIKACQSSVIMPWVAEFSSPDREAFPQDLHYYDLRHFGYTSYTSKPFDANPKRSMFLIGCTLLVEKELVSAPHHAFDTDLGFYCEDTDLALRVNILGYKTVTVPTSIIYHYNSFAMKAQADRNSIQKSTKVIRNRILAFYLNMTNAEFFLYLPFILVGAPFKVRELGWGLGKQLVYGLGAVPVTLLALQQAFSARHKFEKKRRQNLQRRRRGNWWLLRKVLEPDRKRYE